MARKYCGGNWRGVNCSNASKIWVSQQFGSCRYIPRKVRMMARWSKISRQTLEKDSEKHITDTGCKISTPWPRILGIWVTIKSLTSTKHVDVLPNHMGSSPLSQINYQSYVPWNDSRSMNFVTLQSPRIQIHWYDGSISMPRQISIILSEAINLSSPQWTTGTAKYWALWNNDSEDNICHGGRDDWNSDVRYPYFWGPRSEGCNEEWRPSCIITKIVARRNGNLRIIEI